MASLKLREAVSLLARLFGFVGIPFLLAWGIISFLEEEARSRALVAQDAAMREVLAEAATYGDPVKRSEQALLALTTGMTSLDPWLPRLTRLQAGLRDRLELFLFDARGEPLTVAGLPVPGRVAARQFLQTLLDPHTPHNPRLVAAFGGNPRGPFLMARSPGSFCDLQTGGRKNWGGWWPLRSTRGRPLGHLLAFLHKPASVSGPDSLLDEAVTRANRRHGRYFKVGWIDPAFPASLRPRGPRWPPALAKVIGNRPLGEAGFSYGGRRGLTACSDHGAVLFCLALRRPLLPSVFDQGRFACQLAAFLLSVGFLTAAAGRLPIRFGLRGQLALLFLVCGGVPLAILMTTALIDRQDRETVLLDQVRRTSLEHLTTIDQELSFEYWKLARSYRQMLRRLVKVPTASLPAALEPLRRHNDRQAGIILQMLVVDTRGNLLFCDNRSSHQGPGGARTAVEVNRNQSLQLLRGYNGDLAIAPQEEGSKPSLDSLAGTTGKVFFKQLLSRADSIQNLQLFDQEVPAFLGPLPDLEDPDPDKDSVPVARALLTVLHQKGGVHRRFLRRISRVLAGGGPERPRFLAIPVHEGKATTAFPNPRLGRHPGLRRLKELAAASRLPQHQVLGIGRQEYLVSAVSGQNLDGYVLMLAQPLDRLRSQTRVLNLRLGALSAGLLALALGFSWLASSLLLTPVSQLGTTLEALSRRDFSRRALPGRVEELARLADRLNLVMEEFRELQVAKTVQEHLWPSRPLAGPDWEVYGTCRTATDLGGDHHDWFPLPDGRILLTLGDVAGHGIPAALLEAAAKVFLALNAVSGAGPAGILEAMNRNFFDSSSKTASMTMWVGIFDPHLRRLDFASAGHTFPIVLPRDGPAELLKGSGLPLGIRRNLLLKEGHLELGGGATVVVYSDGLVEARDQSGLVFSFQRLVGEADRRRHLPPAKLAAELFDLTAAWSGREVPDDDQTMVILRVDPSSGGGS